MARMSAQATAKDGKSWALSTLDAVPAENASTRQELGPGRRPILSRGADIATGVHTAVLRRRDGRPVLWCLPIALIVALLVR